MVVHLEVCCVWFVFGFVCSFSHFFWGGGGFGGLVCESVGKAEMLSAHFDGKQSRDPVAVQESYLTSISQSHCLCLKVNKGGEAVTVGSGFLWWH